MKTLLLVPTEAGVGLTTICLELLPALDQQGLRVAFCKPVGQPDGEIATATVTCSQAAEWLAGNQVDPVLARLNPLLADSFDAQVILVSTPSTASPPHTQTLAELNQRLENCAAQFMMPAWSWELGAAGSPVAAQRG
jgi:BioD-like phosphotransacetylase family protein